MTTSTSDTSAERELVIVRVFDAPRALVFQNWLEPELIPGWFATDHYEVTSCAVDARPGGRWRVDFRSEAGATYSESGAFEEIEAPERLVFTLVQATGRDAGPETRVTVTFAERGAQTEMTFRQTGFASAAHRDGNAEGWGECFRKLDRQLESPETRELRALFAAWFDASSARDLDASMAPIAPGVVSYEHQAPLQQRGIAPLRESCRAGFEVTPGELRWDTPELQIVVRGDLAITWGLDRVRMQPPGEPPRETWSRGTRVFQKLDGAWRLIHQHLSFPFDPATGRARLDLAP